MASLYSVLTRVCRWFNYVFISFKTYVSREQHIPTPPNANLCFIVFSILGFLQIKSQGNPNDSPFLTNPKTCTFAIIMLLFYGLAYDIEQRLSSTHSTYANAARCVTGLFGSLLMASLASILFPRWLLPVFYVMYILFYAGEMMDWIQTTFVNEPEEIHIDLPV